MVRAIFMVMFFISTGCVSHGGVRSMPELARFEAYVDTQQVNAPQAYVVHAAQTVLAEHGWAPTEAGTFAGRVVVKGMPRRAAVINARLPDDRTYVADAGCRVDIFPQPTGVAEHAHALRVTCHGPRASVPVGAARAMPQRVEWLDRYLAAQIIARVHPRRAPRIWQLEPTGQRSMRCAQLALRRVALPLACARGAARPLWVRRSP